MRLQKQDGVLFVHWEHFTERLNVQKCTNGKEFIVFDNEIDCAAFMLDIEESFNCTYYGALYDFNGNNNALSLSQVVLVTGEKL